MKKTYHYQTVSLGSPINRRRVAAGRAFEGPCGYPQPLWFFNLLVELPGVRGLPQRIIVMTCQTKRTRSFLMAAYVLVGGAWLGGWCWQPVARRLREAGHEAYPVTLTGLGERSHLSNPEVNLDTHITDVVNLIEFEDLRDVVLLGHSYAGIVVTGAADRVPERIAQLVYLDSGPVPDGVSFLDTPPPEIREHTERQVAEHGNGWLIPVPSWEELENVNGASLEGLGEEER